MRIRRIAASDRERTIAMLTAGFARKPEHWRYVWQQLTYRDSPDGFPRYGFLLEVGDDIVGVLLTIFSRVGGKVRCNLSSWTVREEYRGYATLLSAKATSRPDVTYINVSAAPHTWSILEAQGFRRYAAGRMLVLPALSQRVGNRKVGRVDRFSDVQVPAAELLRHHASYGCLSLICETDHEPCPFVFRLHRRAGIPVASLIYCNGVRTFVQEAATIGRYLVRHGYLLVAVDTNERLERLPGWFLGDRPRFVKGDDLPVGDLAYTELALFEAGR